ncbi:MAG TPA: YetF domain-containing protein [Mobilitalea sp.]|nr:YetF domain-containing protein [Mobilitalea sp.]
MYELTGNYDIRDYLKDYFHIFYTIPPDEIIGEKAVKPPGITIGSIAANIISNLDKPFLADILGMVWWYILTALLGLLGLKFSGLRNMIDGQPTIVIKKGIILKKSLQKTSLNMDDLSMMLREHNVFSILEVEYAILEPDGKLSVIKKPQKQQVTKEDMNIVIPESKYLPSEIIVDGKLLKQNLLEYGLDEVWLFYRLDEQGITSIKEVLYAEIQSDGTLYLQKTL